MINPNDVTHRMRLQRAVVQHDTALTAVREKRNELLCLHRGEDYIQSWAKDVIAEDDYVVYVNLIQQMYKGRILALAGRNTQYSVDARTVSHRGVDKEIQNFANAYSSVLDLGRVHRQCAGDTTFGIAAAKVMIGQPPKGVFSPYSPRAYRIDPNMLVYDRSAPTWEEATFIGDMYLRPLNEARADESYDENSRMFLSEWNGDSGNGRGFEGNSDSYAEPMVRLVDIYFPASGLLATWEANDSSFGSLVSEPLRVIPMPINPYEIVDLMPDPQYVNDLTTLDSLKHLHVLANILLSKDALRAVQSKQHPIGEMGADSDLDNIINTPDGDPVLVSDISKIGVFNLPGADGSATKFAGLALSMFSQYGGNLEVALGQSPGAATARQTQSLIEQVSAQQQLDRSDFEQFQANVMYKLISLAGAYPHFSFEALETIPGTNVDIPVEWPPPEMSGSVIDVDRFLFSVVPYSSQFRTPQDKIRQLTDATTQMIQLMQAKAIGAPLNMEVILQDFAEAFDEVPRLREWWSGDEPSSGAPGEAPGPASINAGSDIRYNPALGGGSGGAGNPFDIASTNAQPGGLQLAQGGVQ